MSLYHTENMLSELLNSSIIDPYKFSLTLQDVLQLGHGNLGKLEETKLFFNALYFTIVFGYILGDSLDF